MLTQFVVYGAEEVVYKVIEIEAPDAYGVSINRLDLAELKLSEEGGHLVQFYINNSGRD